MLVKNIIICEPHIRNAFSFISDMQTEGVAISDKNRGKVHRGCVLGSGSGRKPWMFRTKDAAYRLLMPAAYRIFYFQSVNKLFSVLFPAVELYSTRSCTACPERAFQLMSLGSLIPEAHHLFFGAAA